MLITSTHIVKQGLPCYPASVSGLEYTILPPLQIPPLGIYSYLVMKLCGFNVY